MKSPIDFPAFGSSKARLYATKNSSEKALYSLHLRKTRVNRKTTRERVNCFFLRIDKWMIVQCEVISVTGRNRQSTTLPS